MRFSLAFVFGARRAEGCAFAASGGVFPQDDVHQKIGGVSLIPDRLSTGGNAFTSQSMLKPAVPTGGSRSLADELIDFADMQSEDMCYWSFQPLATPKGEGRSLLHPRRHYWELENGQWDDDIEWQSMLANIASARLKRIQELSNGTLVSTMCAAGRDLAQRRCNNGRAATDTWMNQCDPAIYNQEIRWGMAITIWKIGPELKEWVRYWRSNNSFGHTPNIQWTYRGGSPSSEPYVYDGGAPLPPPTEIDHKHVPHGPFDWAASRGQWGAGDGASMLAKVLPCLQVPAKFQEPKEQYYCDHVSEGASQTTADEAYDFWKNVESSWPPTKKCADNVTRLNEVLGSIGIPTRFNDCATAMKSLKTLIGNFNCDAIVPGRYMFRDVCCSECGAESIPDLPESPPPTPAPTGDVYVCQVCQHVYDAAEDGDGLAFESLAEDWVCPICGMPKAAYQKKTPEQEELV